MIMDKKFKRNDTNSSTFVYIFDEIHNKMESINGEPNCGIQLRNYLFTADESDKISKNMVKSEQVQIKVEETIPEIYVKEEISEYFPLKKNDMPISLKENLTETIGKVSVNLWKDIEKLESGMINNHEIKCEPNYNINIKEEICETDDILSKDYRTEETSRNNDIYEQFITKYEDTMDNFCTKKEITEELIIKNEPNIFENDDNAIMQGEQSYNNDVQLLVENEYIPGSSLSKAAINPSGNLLPQKSKKVYENYYAQFVTWQKNKNVKSFSENIILDYFSEISNKMKPSTLWKTYFILRSTISVKHNINITEYAKLRAFLKQQSDGYQGKKSKTLTPEEMKKFIDEAPDDIYLATKVASIVGIMGACRKSELWQMKLEHIEDLGTAILIRVPDTKAKTHRKFTITGCFYTKLKKYLALRPANASSNKFFLNYQKGRCFKNVIGINKFGVMPKQIAKFLQLRDPDLYTGHCFKRTSATMLVDADGDITT